MSNRVSNVNGFTGRICQWFNQVTTDQINKKMLSVTGLLSNLNVNVPTDFQTPMCIEYCSRSHMSILQYCEWQYDFCKMLPTVNENHFKFHSDLCQNMPMISNNSPTNEKLLLVTGLHCQWKIHSPLPVPHVVKNRLKPLILFYLPLEFVW